MTTGNQLSASVLSFSYAWTTNQRFESLVIINVKIILALEPRTRATDHGGHM